MTASQRCDYDVLYRNKSAIERRRRLKDRKWRHQRARRAV